MANKITITPASLAQSAERYRSDLLMMPAQTIRQVLPYFSVRTGIRYKETVGQLGGEFELGPYSATRKDDGDITVTGRTLETFLGSIIKDFEPNQVVQSIYGAMEVQGEALKGVNITRAVLSYMMMRISHSLMAALFVAKRNDGGTKSAELFNGFDTIADTEKTAGNISEAKGNMCVIEAITAENAVDQLKAIYRAAHDELRAVPTIMYLPQTVYDYYCDDYKATTGAIPYNTQYKQTFLEGSDNLCRLQPLACKRDAKYIQLSTRGNMLIGTGAGVEGEGIQVDRFSPFVLTFSLASFFGTQYESISPERLMVATIDGATAVYGKAAAAEPDVKEEEKEEEEEASGV